MDVYENPSLYKFLRDFTEKIELMYPESVLFGSIINEFALNELFHQNRNRLISNEHSIHWIYPKVISDAKSIISDAKSTFSEHILVDFVKFFDYQINLECVQKSSKILILTYSINTNIMVNDEIIFWNFYFYVNLEQQENIYSLLQYFMYGNTYLIRTNFEYCEWNFQEKRKKPLDDQINENQFRQKICIRLPQSELQFGLFDNYRELYGFSFFQKTLLIYSHLSKILMGHVSVHFNTTECNTCNTCNICYRKCANNLLQAKCCKQLLCSNCVFRIFLERMHTRANCPYCRSIWIIQAE